MLYGKGYQSVQTDNGGVVTFEAIVVDPGSAEPIMWDAYLHGLDPNGGLLLGIVGRIDHRGVTESDYWLHTAAGIVHEVVDPLLGNVEDVYDRRIVGPVTRTDFEMAIKEWVATVFG